MLLVQAAAQTADLINEHFELLNSLDVKGLANEYAV
jgi:hypothetical protein